MGNEIKDDTFPDAALGIGSPGLPGVKSSQKRLYRLANRFLNELSAVGAFADRATLLRYFASIAIHLPAIVREGNLKSADRGIRDRTFEARIFGQRLMLPGDCFSGAREIYGRKVYFALPDFRLHPKDVVIDLGANTGLLTLLSAGIGARTIAVEAQDRFIPIIKANLRANSCESNTDIEWGLIGELTGVMSSPANRRSASHYAAEAPILTLNALVSKYHLSRIDFLKIDIEGSEFDLLSRNLDWLSITKRLVMEVHPAFGDAADLVKVLRAAGFETRLFENELCPTDRLGPSGGYLYASRSGQGER